MHASITWDACASCWSCSCTDLDNAAGLLPDSIAATAACNMTACEPIYFLRLVCCALVQEDMMMGEGEDSEQQEGSQHVGLLLLMFACQ